MDEEPQEVDEAPEEVDEEPEEMVEESKGEQKINGLVCKNCSHPIEAEAKVKRAFFVLQITRDYVFIFFF